MGKVNTEITFDPVQEVIFNEFARNKNLTGKFYFTGGTALSAVYLHHRVSEDLDFFSEKEFDIQPIIEFIKHVSSVLKVEYRIIPKEVVKIFEFYKQGKFVIKVDFGFYPYQRLKTGKKVKGVNVDSVADIAANKMLTILQRREVKDFVDLFFLLKQYTIWDLLYFVKVKFNMEIDTIWLASGCLKAGSFENLPKMLVPLDMQELKAFYKDLAKQLGMKVVKK